jgi:hypothetical protein
MRLVENELRGMSKAKDEAVRYIKKEKKVFQAQNIYNQVLTAAAKEDVRKFRELAIELENTKDRILA